MLTGQPRTATALATTDCVLFYINQQDFEAIAMQWPKAFSTILAKAKERLERVANANSTALASQLGERLSEMRSEAGSEQGVLGHVARHTNRPSTPNDRTTGHPSTESHSSKLAGGTSRDHSGTPAPARSLCRSTTHAAFAPRDLTKSEHNYQRPMCSPHQDLAAEVRWRDRVEHDLRSQQDAVNTILERLAEQGELLQRIAATNGAATPTAASAGGSNTPLRLNSQRERLPPLLELEC